MWLPSCTCEQPDPPVCGNGVREDGEACDGADLGLISCASVGRGTGQATCTSACTPDLSECSECGDGAATGTEACDGADLRDADCTTLGFEGGSLGCADCAYVTDGCFACGDGALGGDEDCDGATLPAVSCADLGFESGAPGCAADCHLDTSGCVPFNPFALSFDGLDDLVSCSPLSLALPLQSFTLELWLRADIGSSLGTVLSKWTCDCAANPPRTFVLRFEDGFVHMDAAIAPDCWNFVSTNIYIGYEAWHHVAFSWELDSDMFGSKVLRIFLDGVLLWEWSSGFPETQPLPASPWSLLMGNDDGSCSNLEPFAGDVDEVRFWSIARTEADLADRFVQLTGSEPDLVAYWPFDEGAGDVTAELVSGTSCTLGNLGGPDPADAAWSADTPF